MRKANLPILVAFLVTACTPSTPEPVVPVMVTDAAGAELGEIMLPVVCAAPADDLVRRGLALYHNMTFVEAEAEFQAAAEADPECALAYWGVAMSYVHTLWPDTVAPEQLAAGRAALDQARAASTRDARDDAYIAAIAGYYEDAENRSEAERLMGFHEGWAAAHEAFPDDLEAQSLYALSLLATAPKDPEFPNQRRAGELLEEVRAAMPNHPGGMHYTIHAYDFPPLAAGALEVAHTYGRVIPENSHALHMTSHIFTRLGHWPDSIEYNRRAADVAAQHPMGGRVSHHYLHALDYLAYAYLQQGLDDRAAEVYAEMQSLGEMHDSFVTAYSMGAVPVRLAIEVRDWDRLAELTSAVDTSQYPAFTAMTVFGAGMAAVHRNDLATARAAVDELATLREASTEMAGAYDWASQVEIQRLTLQAWVEHTEGGDGTESAMAAVQRERANPKSPVTPGVVLPAAEAIADMLFTAGNYADAQMFYAESLERNPNRFRSLLGAGDSARLAGRDAQAREYYEQLLTVAPDSTREELDAVREYLGN